MVTMKLHGIEEIIKELQQIPDRAQDRILTATCVKSAKVIAMEARQRAPVGQYDSGRRGGTLKRAIKWIRGKQTRKYSRGHVLIEHGTYTKGKKKGQTVKNDAFYWRFIEFGHLIGRRGEGQGSAARGFPGLRNRKWLTGWERAKITGRSHVPAIPFLRSAFRNKGQEVTSLFASELKTNFQKITRIKFRGR